MGGFVAVASAVAGLAGAYGSYRTQVSQANAQAAAAQSQAETARRNAELASERGIAEVEAGAREEQRFRRQARQFAATQESQLATNGLTLDGSTGSILMQTAGGIEEDAQTIRWNAANARYEHEMQSRNFLNQSYAYDAQADSARDSAKNAKWGLAGSLLGVGAGLYSASNNVNYRAGGFDVQENTLMPSDWYNQSYSMTGTPTGMTAFNNGTARRVNSYRPGWWQE